MMIKVRKSTSISLYNFGTQQKKQGLGNHTIGKDRNPMSSFSSALLLQLIIEA
jgi:hypothetical protein